MDWDAPPIKNVKVEHKQKVYEMEVGKNSTSKKKLNTKLIAVISIVSVVLFLSAFVIRPAIIGYSVLKQAEGGNLSVSELGANVQDLKYQLASTKANLSLYSEVYSQIWQEVRITTNDLTKCLSEKESANLRIENVRQQWKDEIDECENNDNAQVIDLNQQLTNKNNEVTNVKSELTDLQEDFDKFVESVAKNVCCKAKVDNPNIDSYEVSNNKLLCLDGGKNSLSC